MEEKKNAGDWLKPIVDGLFGEQKPYTMAEPEKPEPVPIGTIVADLTSLSEEAWGPYAFSREPLNGRFTEEERRDMTRRAVQCGQEEAARAAAEYGTKNVLELADALGVTVERPQRPQFGDRVLFAEYREPDRIFLYQDGIDKGKKLLQAPGLDPRFVSEARLSDILLGHELFHVVEEQRKTEVWTKSFRYLLWKLGPLKNRSQVVILSEIAAMSFSKTLHGLSWSPFVLDAFLVYAYSPEAGTALYQEMCGLTGISRADTGADASSN